jgi:preprotein translocase subunit SecA
MVADDAFARYEEREAELGEEVMRKVERRVMLSVVDRVWREHLYEMDHLRDGIGLRSVGQRDPLVEYQREAYDAFKGMMDRIQEEATGYFYNLPVQQQQQAQEAQAKEKRSRAEISRPALRDSQGQAPQKLNYTSSTTAGAAATKSGSSYTVGAGTSATGGGGGASPAGPSPQAQAQAAAAAQTQGTVVRDDKVGRNEPCPCGSGLKYKKCHGA